MGWSEIPLYHLLTVPFVIFSALLYIYLIVNILRRRRSESSLFQTPFFTLVLGQAFWDLSMFCDAFFFVFCRRYLLIPFPVSENGFYPKLMYFLQTFFTNGMYMSSVLYALSRMTAFIWPAKQDSLWSTRNIFLAMIFIGVLASVNGGRLFIGNPSVSLRIIAPGRMKMFQDDSLLQQDGYQDLALSGGCCIICFIIYTWAAWRSKFIGTKGSMKYQKKFLICAITTFLPYIPNAIKSYLLIYAGMTNNVILTGYCIEAWLFVIYFMCLVQPWVLLYSYPRIRPSLGPNQPSETSRSHNQTTGEQSSRLSHFHAQQTTNSTVISPIC